jgi:hypothetical protein
MTSPRALAIASVIVCGTHSLAAQDLLGYHAYTLVEGRATAAAPAFAYELSSLRDVLKRIGAQVADERADLAMEAAELDRLSIDLHTKRSTRG